MNWPFELPSILKRITSARTGQGVHAAKNLLRALETMPSPPEQPPMPSDDEIRAQTKRIVGDFSAKKD